MVRKFDISVPASSANIGPGFDVLGLALASYLELQVVVEDESSNEDKVSSAQGETGQDPHGVTLTYSGEGEASVPKNSDQNLITRTALYVLRCNGLRTFPHPTRIHVVNPIPLGRGMGSSGAAVVGGVILGNEIGQLGLSKQRMLDYCLMIERHPDNITAAMMGGFVGSYLRELSAEDTARKEIPLSEVLPEPAGGIDTGLVPPAPPMDIGHHIKYDWTPEIKCVCIIPDFELATAKARGVLPGSYTASQVIFNLQRLAVLTTALTRSPPDAGLIFEAMQDKIHQPFRKNLIPGLSDVLANITPSTHPGLLGICISGAGPTILALATDNFDSIATEIMARINQEGVSCKARVLDLAYEGSQVVEK
ncbi:homoserine kinase [Nadsonia fulvescens var. elongata DSM 6958]|uniref:Homoserine kinase n=1 Tax=Nadsonia fulvescens var. elongata DSM 6958 TaxID=857566 RepID=A0A1E3PCM0_9ASCO|nr:homoserine kinase [Nadsonia fulvescens var. elongata DSM 6958]